MVSIMKLPRNRDWASQQGYERNKTRIIKRKEGRRKGERGGRREEKGRRKEKRKNRKEKRKEFGLVPVSDITCKEHSRLESSSDCFLLFCVTSEGTTSPKMVFHRVSLNVCCSVYTRRSFSLPWLLSSCLASSLIIVAMSTILHY